uniref:(California timema) hypothetical protein n=1 Tax=Timema californicum TaxID=61474 RepID=A0A7R9J594_TIMCA|nr:unnamed protein product [Timema californicum]
MEPPEAPGRVEVLEVASRWVSVAWGAPYSGHAPISHYVVQFHEDELGDSPWSNVTVGGGSRTARLGALRPATSYTIRLLAVNDVGAGPPSESTMAVTLQEAPSGPPTDVVAEPTSSESILIRWKPPLVSYSHGEILGYQVAFREVSSATPGAQQVRSVRGRNRLEVTLPSLRQYTRYEVSVRAFNLVGSGPSSPQLYVTTLEGVPDMPPQDLRCTALTSQSVRVRWEPPPLEHRNGVVEGYKVFYKHANPRQGNNTSTTASLCACDCTITAGGSPDVEVKKTTNLETNLHGLTKFTNYSVRVLGFTAAGEGVRSSPIYCTTEEDGACPETMSVLQDVHKDTVFGDRELIFEARRLKEFQRYEFWVTAATVVGEGPSSPRVSQSPISRVPARIASFSRRVVAGAGQSVVLPCHAVGLPAPSRSWRGPSGGSIPSGSHHLKVLPDHGLALAQLRLEDAGNYTCLAENVFGRDEVMYGVTVQVAPSPPVLVAGSSTAHSLALQWRVPDTGGSPITDRKMYSLEGIKCGSTYKLYLTATNAVGTGKPSQTISASTKGGAPKVPVQDDFLVVNSTSVTLILEAWPSNGCPLLYFVVEYRPRGQSEWTLVSNNVQQEEMVIPDLAPANWYAVRVSAHNDAGSSQQEFVFATRTRAGEIIVPDLTPDVSEQQSTLYAHLNVIIPIISGIICTIAVSICVCIFVHRRNYSGYKQGDAVYGAKSLAELENQRNSDQQGVDHGQPGQLYSPSPARKGDSSLSGQKGSDTSGQDYEICPYATFSLPGAGSNTPNNTKTMDYSIQFQTFSQQECYAGQPRPGTSSRSGGKHEYYARVRGKSNSSRSSGDIKMALPRTSKSPPDGLSLEISCISSQQTLPMSVATASNSGGRSKSPTTVYPSRARSCDRSDSDSSGAESKAPQYRLPPSGHRTPHTPHNDCAFELDSSTESTEASPEVNLRPRRSGSSGGGMVARRGAPSSRCFGQQKKSGCSGSGCGQEMVPLQPPSGFSDCQQELSEAECDRRETGVSLPLFRHEELEQELSTLVHRYTL